ncbi:MAG: hypothetical protein LUG99_23405 [Lachnospiraceae bacterium]|nr:hypothetical protein [Lachnospiraceae bacterium]
MVKKTEEQEQKYVVALADLKEKADVDPVTVDRESLVDIENVKIRTDLDTKERMLDYIRQIKNPYCYLSNGMVVKISFSGKKPLQECLKESLF